MGYGAASGASGAPRFNTGNPMWDNNFNLAHSLFGDPSAGARGAALGASARENLLKGDQSIAERNSAQRLAELLAARDRTGQPVMPPQMTYHQSGVTGGGLIPDPPPGVPITPTPQALAQAPGFLASLFHSGTTGTPPPVSSPAPNSGAPPAPNTTTSNGQTPQNEQGSGTLNYNGANLDGGGGRQYAPAAQSNGSPAQVPIGLGTIMGLAAMAGQNPEMVKLTLGATIDQALEHGQIPWHTANAFMGGPGVVGATQLMAGIGNTAPYESSEQSGRNVRTIAGENYREQLSQAGQSARNAATIAGENYRFGETAQQGLVTRDASGMPVVNLPSLTPGGPVRPVGPGFNQSLADQENQQVLAYQKRPDGSIDYISPPIAVTRRQARQQNLPIFTEGQKGAGSEPSPGSDEAIARSIYVQRIFKQAYAPGDASWTGQTAYDAKPTLNSDNAVADYAEFLREQSRGTMTTNQAYNMAQQELQQQGYLPTKAQTDDARNAVYFRSNPAVTTDAKGAGTGWSIPLLKPYVSPRGNGHIIAADANQSGANRHGERIDTTSMRPTMPTVPTRPAAVPPTGGAGATRQSPAGQLLGNAPAGAQNGFMTDASGRKIEVRDGKVYSAQ